MLQIVDKGGDFFQGHNGITFSARANTPFSGTVATFTDPTYPDNIPSDFTATIAWGDGTTTAGTVNGGSHTYAAAGTDTVAVTLSDDPPGTATPIADSTADVTSPVMAGNAQLDIAPSQTLDLTHALLNLDLPGQPGDTLELTAVGTTGTRGVVTVNNGDLTYRHRPAAAPTLSCTWLPISSSRKAPPAVSMSCSIRA